MAEDDTANSIAALLTDFSTKIRDLEERHNLLKEKVLLLGQSFLKGGDRMSKEMALVKSDIRDLKTEVERIKDGIQHIIGETSDFARKEELSVLEKYMKIWEPLKFVKEEDVKRMIDEALAEKKA
jgi:hypothetical protein